MTMTPQSIDQAFKELETRVLGGATDGTSCEDVLQYLYENQDQIWHMSWEFVGRVTKDGRFLSHRAPARASDLAIHDPQLVEDRKISRYKAYRLRTENMTLIEARLGKQTTVEKPKERKVEFVTIDGQTVVREIFV